MQSHDDRPVTTAARTVLDCLRQLRLRDALAIADRAVGSGLTTVEELSQMRAFQSRWPGVLKADVGLTLVDGRRESWLESASVAAAHEHGFSMPESQIRIHRLDGTFVARVDLLWRQAGVVGEADGKGKYRGDFDDGDWSIDQAADVVLAERDRERELEALGFGVARWGSDAVLRTGADVPEALRAARRRARPQDIRCLWRAAEDDPLRAWVWPDIASSEPGPSAA